MRRKRMARDTIGLTATGATLGIGGSMLETTGTPLGAKAGLTAFGSMMPAMGTAMGGGYAIQSMMDMIPKKKKR